MKKILTAIALLALTAVAGGGIQAQCATGVSDCYLVVDGQDQYGDGWNGGYLSFSQGGIALGTFSLTGATGRDTIRLCTAGGPVACSWTPGDYDFEVSFTITDSLGSVLYVSGAMDEVSGLLALLAPCPSCPAPAALTATAIGTATATVSWHEVGSAASWYYRYGTSASPSGDWLAAYDTVVGLSGLQPNTLYHFFVYADCGGGDTSAVAAFAFRTACGDIVLPYSEGFESYDAVEQMPYCWMRMEVATAADYSGGVTAYPYVSSDEGHTGARSLYFASYYGIQSVASPMIAAAASSVEVQLWMKGGDAIQVGYATSTDSAAAFHPLTTIGPSNDTTYTDSWGLQNTDYLWTKYTVRFDTVGTADSIHLVLRATASMEYEPVYVDDVVIRLINTCPEPESLAVTATASEEVTLGWTCPGGSQWQVAYGPAGFNPDDATGLVSASTPSVILSGLDNAEVYDFYVRTVCGTQHSYWSTAVSAMPNLYALTAAVDTVTSCDITLVDDGGIDGDFSLDLNQMLVLLPSEEDQTIRVRGFVHLYNSYGATYATDMNILRIYAGSDTSGRLLASYNTVDIDSIDLASDVGPMTLWFRTGSYSDDYNDGFQLHVTCEDRPTCLSSYGLTVSNVAGTYVMVSWQYDESEGEAPGFVLTVTDADSNEVREYNLPGTDRNYVLLGLTERTAYQVQLATDCDGTELQTAHFVTSCDNGGEVSVGSGTATDVYMPAYLYAQSSFSQQLFSAADLTGVPVIKGFKVYMTNSAATPGRQWDIYLDTTSRTSYGSVADYVAPAATNLYFSGEVNIAQGWVEVVFDSAFSVPAGKSVAMTVRDRTGVNGSSRYFRVTTTADTTSIYGYSSSGMVDVTNSTSVAGTNPVARKRRNTIRFITSCDTMGCVAPVIVSAVPAAHSVTLTWVPVGDENEWKVEYRIGTGSWQLAAASVTDTSYTVTGLAATTTYAFRVSSLCGDEESSRNISATTTCGEEPLPFSQGFEVFQASSYSDALTPCWVRGSNTGYYPYRESGYGYQSSYSLYMGGYRAYIVLPKMAARVDSLSVSFYAVNGTPDLSDATVEVGICTNPADTSTFTVMASRPLTEGLWQHVEVDLEDYSGPDGFIFIRALQEGAVSLSIDNVLVTLLPDCRRVTDADVGDVTLSSAQLTITDNHGYGNYIVYYGTANDTATADTLHVSGTSVALTGLLPNTQYYVWVAAQCAVGSESRLFAVQPFRTLCHPIAVSETMSYLQEFESGTLECMAVESLDALRWVVTTSSGTPHAHSGSYMASVSSAADHSSMLILPTFDFSALTGDAEFSFYRYQHRSLLPNVPATPAGRLEVYYRPAASGSWTLLAVVDSSVNSWDRVLCTLPFSQGATLYQVALKGSPRGNTGGLFVDDLRVTAPSACPIPTDVSVRNISAREATVAWTGSASAYKVQYRTSGSLSWSSRIVEYADTANIGPLDMATAYEVRVAAVCGPYSLSEASNVTTFVTDFCDNRLEADNHAPSAPAAVSTQAPVYTSRN